MNQVNQPALQLRWLGHPRVELSGTQVRLETRKTTALLAYLSLNSYPQSRERLAALFWPEFDQTRAPANLRRTLASLHASIPGDWIEAERDAVSLRPAHPLWIDVLAVRRLASDIRAHPHEPQRHCAECLELAVRATGLFGGEFLEGFNLPDCPEFDDWQSAQRESLKLELSWLLERAASGYAAEERWEDALKAARRWLTQDKLHEPAQALLMRILALSGRRSAAIRQYEEYAEALGGEFGQEPEEGTRELYNRILSREIGPRASDAVGGTGSEPKAAARGAREPGTSAHPERAGAARGAAVPPLLATKLFVPPLREGIVSRPRLMRLLEEGLHGGLVVVSAPAGFGKTTILSELAAQTKAPVAWLSLDEGDNDQQRFLLHLVGSLRRAANGMGEEAAEMLTAMPPAPSELVMTALLNSVDLHAVSLVLVLDDSHFVRSPAVQAALRFLIDHRPLSLAVVIAGRADPPFPLARLRAQRRVTEIRAEDLRFTAAEAVQFFDRTMSLSLTAEQVAVLERKTEGWAAGLQMAALSLAGRADVEEFIASFGGTHRYVLDYLAEEVLSRQEEGVRQFLLDTSLLRRMSPELCDAVTGGCGCGETLEHLERGNLFLVALDEERRWYRYHHLFADLLRHKLARERTPDEIRALHRKAADWLARAGELLEAIEEYLAAAAYDEAARLIEERFFEILSAGALSQLERWCADIPAKLREKRPGFCVAAAWALTWVGRREEAEELLDRVERAIFASCEEAAGAAGGTERAEARPILGSISTIRAILADMSGHTARAVELARVADGLLAEGDVVSKSVVLYIIEKSYYYEGRLEEAERGCGELLRASRATGSIFSICAAVCELARLRGLQGRRREGEAILEEFDALAASRHARGSGPVAKAYAILAEFKRERGELDEALAVAARAAREVDSWGMPSDVYITHQYLARVLRSRGETGAALREVAKVESLPQRALVWAMLIPSFEADRVKLLLARGELDAAEKWVSEYRPGKAESPINRELELLSLARIRLAAGLGGADERALSTLLEELERGAREGGRVGPLISIRLLEARLAASRSKEDDALDALDEAVRLAEPERYLLTFVEEGVQIAELLRRGRELGRWGSPPLAEYAGRLLAAFAHTV